MGGLGNQLFQYAFGRAMMHNGIDVRFDISNFGKSKHREYMLGKFNLQLSFNNFTSPKTILDSKGVPSFDKAYLKMDGRNFFGYWQYLDYFRHILSELKDEIWVKEEAYNEEFLKYKQIIISTECVSVHVRRDDYLTSDTIPCLPFIYYYEAITNTKGDLFIFSDDIDWCKKHFHSDYFDREVTFISLPYYLDFELMRMCSHNVISNSTFSYWAALLNNNNDKVVVTPDFWITKYDHAVRNNFPKEWIKLKCNV